MTVKVKSDAILVSAENIKKEMQEMVDAHTIAATGLLDADAKANWSKLERNVRISDNIEYAKEDLTQLFGLLDEITKMAVDIADQFEAGKTIPKITVDTINRRIATSRTTASTLAKHIRAAIRPDEKEMEQTEIVAMWNGNVNALRRLLDLSYYEDKENPWI